MLAALRVPAILLIGSTALAGCSGGLDMFGGNSSDVTTNAIAQQAPKVDPACGNLAVEIDGLRREGVADKVERAAAKKYKMTAADLAKANMLNKANGEFQAKCSTLPRPVAMPEQKAPAAAAAAKAVPAAVKAAPAAAKSAAAPAAAAVASAAQ